jgi:uncharacterized protein
MGSKEEKGKDGKKHGILDMVFPSNYDFFGMLSEQAKQTDKGVRSLIIWLDSGGNTQPAEIVKEEDFGDQIRLEMERQLESAFSTPFDRQDIYVMSRQMDYILNYSLSTAYEMRAFGVEPDEAIMKMARSLHKGTELVTKCVDLLSEKPEVAEALIPSIREFEHEIDRTYVQSMAHVFANDEAITAMKKREVYHHLKDAGRNLSITVDVLHRIIVGLT